MTLLIRSLKYKFINFNKISTHLPGFSCKFSYIFSIAIYSTILSNIQQFVNFKQITNQLFKSLTFVWPPFTHSVSCWINSKPRAVICSSSNSPYKCGTHVFKNRYNSSVRFFGILNINSVFNLFLPYDITDVGNGITLPIGRPIRKRKYNGGSAHARAGRGISSKRKELKLEMF